MHTALRLDVEKTVAYGKPNTLHTTQCLDADRTVALEEPCGVQA